VHRELPPDDTSILGHVLRADVTDDKSGSTIPAGTVIDEQVRAQLLAMRLAMVPIQPFVSHEIVYLSADDEDRFTIAQANAVLNEKAEFTNERISARHHQRFLVAPRDRIDYMDVAPRQIVGISAALIPFLEHDDANRALMGSNMQRQAVPLPSRIFRWSAQVLNGSA
jgi:DNA-directed RNA polymerase subunit beta